MSAIDLKDEADKTTINMERLDKETVEEPEETETTEIKVKEFKLASKNKAIIIGLATVVGILTIAIIVVALTIKDPIANEIVGSNVSRRIDCLPKRSLYLQSNDEETCRVKNCIWDLTSGAPDCYYDVNNLKFKLKSKIETKLGTSYTISSINYDYDVLVQFEYLTENVFRFKVKS